MSFSGVLSSGIEFSNGGLVMRMIAILAVLSASLALGGCFHHAQVVTQNHEVLPPLK